MAFEIERKFLVAQNYIKFLNNIEGEYIAQGYISDNPSKTVRLRIIGPKAFLTVKSLNQGATRHEWEYEIPLEDAREMFALPLSGELRKTRYKYSYDGYIWEIDIFHGSLAGLVLAEVELPSDKSEIKLPPFVRKEVTNDARYYNSALARSGQIPIED